MNLTTQMLHLKKLILKPNFFLILCFIVVKTNKVSKTISSYNNLL